MKDRVSIIVPCYNIQDYIGKCLESLIQQTYKDVEIIVVDDGSTDSSYERIKKIAENDERVVLISQNNSGVSTARNIGMAKSTGDYICFVDGDDIVDETYVETLLANMVSYNADLSLTSYTKSLEMLGMPKCNNVDIWTEKEALELYIKESKFIAGAVCKLFKKEIIGDIIFQPELRISEDKLFVFQVMSRCKKIVYQDKKTYYYFQRENSAMHFKFDERFYDAKKVTDYLNKLWKKKYPEMSELFDGEKALSYARRVQDSLHDESEVSKKMRVDFLKYIKKCRIKDLVGVLPKKSICIIMLEKYCLPLLSLYEKVKRAI